MSEIFRQRNASRIVGTSVLIMLLIMLGSLLVLMQKNEVFSKHAIYYLEAEQTQLRGLRRSMDVRILGEPIGTVTDIAYVGNSNKVQLTLKIKVHDDPRKNVIWENSRIVVARSFGIGDRYLEIERGTDMLGAIVSNTTERDYARMRADNETSRGVRIERLVDGSPGQTAGLKSGQVVTNFNGAPLNGIKDLHEAMTRVAPGDEFSLKIYGESEPIRLTADLVEPKRLDPGGVIIQFQPEVDAFQSLADRLALVQESIANVEENVVDTLNKTESDIDTDLKPTIAQYLETGKSIQDTSDKLRLETLTKFAETLAGVDQSTAAVKTQVESIGKQFNTVAEKQIGPAFDKFADASNKLGKTSDSLTETTEQIGKDAGKMITDLQTAATTLNELLEQSRTIVNALESEARDLPGTVRGINQTVDKADTVIDGVSNHWLLRRSVNKSKEKKGQPVSKPTRRAGPIRGLFQRM